MNQNMTAGLLLAEKLALWGNCNGLIIAVSKAGAALGKVVAAELQLPMHVSYCMGIHDPANPKKFVGSVSADTAITHASYDLPQDYLAHQVRLLQQELRNDDTFRLNENLEMADKVVIIIDQHIETIDDLLATIQAARKRNALEVIVAAETISLDAIRHLSDIADEIFYVTTDTHAVELSFFKPESV